MIKFKHNKLYKLIQIKKHKSKNSLAVMCLLELGFSHKEIRAGLIKMNNVLLPELLKAHPDLRPPTLYGTIQGRRVNPKAQSVTAEALGLKVKEIFPKTGEQS